MSDSDFSVTDSRQVEPLIGRPGSWEGAAEAMLVASRTMLSAAAAMSSGAGGPSARERELTAEAVETGVVRALRREPLVSATGTGGGDASPVYQFATGGSIPGTGYGRMGASVTGQGARSQLYGSIGGAIGYAIAGPVGAIIGGMLGGWLGREDEDEQARKEALERQWLNSPEAFEVQAYLYNLSRAYAASWTAGPGRGGGTQQYLSMLGSAGAYSSTRQVVVNMSPGAVQITGQSEESGERAARAFAGALGRVLQLNSVVVPAAGLGGDV